MLGQVQPTQFDLYFPVGKIPVRVTPWFWVLGLLTGYRWISGNGPQRPDLLLVWFACLFVSILIHELGHAFVGQFIGWRSHVFLYHFGGVAVFPDQYRWTPGKWVATCFAGPAAGFLLYGVVVGAEHLITEHTTWLDWYAGRIPPLNFAFFCLKWINLWWGLINLLPVFPLDGGQIAVTILEHKRGRRGAELGCQIGFVVALIAAVALFQQEQRMGGMMFLFLAISNFQRLQMLRGGMW